MENNSDDKLWVDDITVLIDGDFLTEFFPHFKICLNRKLNAITRLSIYVSTALFVYNKNINSLFLALITMSIIYLVNMAQKNHDNYKNINEKNITVSKKRFRKCIKTSQENPFMNVLLTDYQDDPKRQMACQTESSKVVKQNVEDNFNTNLYKDVSNVYNKKFSTSILYKSFNYNSK